MTNANVFCIIANLISKGNWKGKQEIQPSEKMSGIFRGIDSGREKYKTEGIKNEQVRDYPYWGLLFFNSDNDCYQFS